MANNDEHKYATFKVDNKQFKLNYVKIDDYYFGLTKYNSTKVNKIKNSTKYKMGFGRKEYKLTSAYITISKNKKLLNKIISLMNKNNCLYYKFKYDKNDLVVIKFKHSDK